MTTVGIILKKRLLGEIRLLKKDPHKYVDVAPDEKDILTWYFLVKGPEFSDFKNGYYIGKIMHNPEYPLKPPDFMMLTPSGRFNEGNKICLSNSGYHSNEWSALWNIHAILTGFLSIMLDDKEHGISHIHCTKQEREQFAKTSIEYNKKHHMKLLKLFTRFIDENGNPIKDELPITTKTNTSTVIEPIVVKPIIEPVLNIGSLTIVMEPMINPQIIETPKEKKKVKFDIDNLRLKDYSQTTEKYKQIVSKK